MRTAKTLIRLGGCPGWSESSLGTQSLYWFCHVAAHRSLIRKIPNTSIPFKTRHVFALKEPMSWVFAITTGLVRLCKPERVSEGTKQCNVNLSIPSTMHEINLGQKYRISAKTQCKDRQFTCIFCKLLIGQFQANHFSSTVVHHIKIYANFSFLHQQSPLLSDNGRKSRILL